MKGNIFPRKISIIFGAMAILILSAGNIRLGLAMDSDIWNLPMPAGSEILWRDKAIEINSMRAPSTRFLIEMPMDKILAFYKSALLKDKWEELGELAGPNMLGFTKEGKFVYITVFDAAKPPKKDVYVVKSPCSLAVCYLLKDKIFQDRLVDDLPGRDLADVLRYPGSKRRMNFMIPIGSDFLLYEADATPEDIAAFYRKVLKDAGWQENAFMREGSESMIPEEYRDKFAVLSFYRGNDSLVINITSAFEAAKTNKALARRSMIMIARNPGKMVVSTGGKQ